MTAISKLLSSVMSIRRLRSTSTHLLPVTRDHGLVPATAASLPTSAAPPAGPSVATAALDLHAHPSAAGIASSLTPSAASVEMTSIAAAGDADVIDSIQENPDQFPSSSSIMDNLQHSSSLDSFSSTEAINLMEAEGSYPDDNNYHQTENIIRMLGQGTRDNLAARENDIMNTPLSGNNLTNNIAGVDTSRSGNVSKIDEKKKKGLLGCIHTMTERLSSCALVIFTVCGGFFVFNIEGSKKHIPIALILMSGNSLAMLISCFILSPLASYMKESESIEIVEKGMFIWLLLLVPLVYYFDEFCITLPFVASIPAWLPWTLGGIGSLLMLLGGVWFICVKWPKMVEEMKTGSVEANVMLLDGGN